MEQVAKARVGGRSRWVVWLIVVVLMVFFTKFLLHLLLPRDFSATGKMIELSLEGGSFRVPFYCGVQAPKGIVILGTGDGGWSYWEENTATFLAAKGYAVGGWDCRKFADSRTYDYAQLCAGFEAAVVAVRQNAGGADLLPVWYGGWSTGADQSVAAATSANRPKHLIGLLLAAPGSRGRYGIKASDLLGVAPTGIDTYSLAEMVPKLAGLHIVQFIAGLDPLDDEEWLISYQGPKLLVRLPRMMHDMGGAGPVFLVKLHEAMLWSLQAKP